MILVPRVVEPLATTHIPEAQNHLVPILYCLESHESLQLVFCVRMSGPTNSTISNFDSTGQTFVLICTIFCVVLASCALSLNILLVVLVRTESPPQMR